MEYNLLLIWLPSNETQHDDEVKLYLVEATAEEFNP